MLAKKYRLPIQSVVKKRGHSLGGRYFLLKIFSSNLAFNRFGIIISKKVAKKSTERNRLKRLFFNTLKEFIFAGRKKYDFLILVSPNVSQLETKDLKKELQKALNKIYV